MAKTEIRDILSQVRRFVLEERAKRDTPVCGFGLSYITGSIAFPNVRYTNSMADRSRFTSGSPKKLRGHVQAALSILAKEGLMFGRNHTEAGVMSFAHGEVDKRFRVRITQAEAQKRLRSMK